MVLRIRLKTQPNKIAVEDFILETNAFLHGDEADSKSRSCCPIRSPSRMPAR